MMTLNSRPKLLRRKGVAEPAEVNYVLASQILITDRNQIEPEKQRNILLIPQLAFFAWAFI